MTYKEIIKALECCTTKGAKCSDCPAFKKVDRSDCKKYFRGAIDLINRQQAEIDRLRKEVNLVSIQFQDLQERYEEEQTAIEKWKEEANKFQKLWCIAIDDKE